MPKRSMELFIYLCPPLSLSTRVYDLHPVIKDLHADLRAGDVVVAVHEAIYHGHSQNLDRDLVNVLPIDTPDFAADI